MTHGSKTKVFGLPGFSLMELIVIMCVAAIITTIAIPVFRQYEPSIKLRADAQQLTADLRYIQQLTITQQKVYYLEVDMPNKRYSLVKQEDAATPVKTVTLSEGVSFQSVSGFDDYRVIYNSYGAVSQSGNIVLVNSDERTYTVYVRPSGYVQLQQ